MLNIGAEKITAALFSGGGFLIIVIVYYSITYPKTLFIILRPLVLHDIQQTASKRTLAILPGASMHSQTGVYGPKILIIP